MRKRICTLVCYFLALSLLSQPARAEDLSVSAPSPVQDLSAAPSSQLQTAGQIVWVKGTVRANYPEQAPRILARGSLVYEKDTLITEANASAEVNFTDNSIVSLRPDSTFVIEQYKFNQTKSSTSGSFFMNLIKGGFRTITGFVAKAQPDNYQIKTPVATIGVRGTTYQVNCVHQKKCAVGLEKGAGVNVANSGGSVVITPSLPYALIDSSLSKPTLSRTQPTLLAEPPEMTPANSAPPVGTNTQPKGTGGNCGILIQ